MRYGFVGVMLKPTWNHRIGWGKGLLYQNSTDESIKDQGNIGCVLWLEMHCPSWICTTWSDGKRTVVPESFSTFEGCCAQDGAWIVAKRDTDVAPWQRARSHVAPHPQLSGKTSDIHCAPSTQFSGHSPSRIFSVSQTLKGHRFQTTAEIQERELHAITECAFQEESNDGTNIRNSVSSVEGTALNRTVLTTL
jgi:hypothetical protein